MNSVDLAHWLNKTLKIADFIDYCPNGLQVEGDGRPVNKVALAVTATTETLEKAVALGADLLLTHHGLFWDGQSFLVTNTNRQKLKLLIENGMGLASYHLPLDFHPEWGNHIQLAHQLGLRKARTEGTLKQPHGFAVGQPEQPGLGELLNQLSDLTGQDPRVAAFGPDEIKKIFIATGGAQKGFTTAAHLGADLYLTGEGTEQSYHEAQDLGCHFVAMGHHQSEQYGVQGLGDLLAQEWGISSFFVEVKNPF